jgi:LmbE family N-acetylglucosaminyl deacetylase
MPQTVLAVSAHPDDETLGVGGRLLAHRAAGDRIAWLIATRAAGDRWTDADRTKKSLEIQLVAEAYGVSERFELGLPSAALDQVAANSLMDGISAALASVRPKTVYIVHGGDVHTDHRAVFHAAMSVLKPFHMSRFGVERVVSYETLSSTDAAPLRINEAFIPNVFWDVSEWIDRKIEIMSLYASETQPDPMPRGPSAIRALARLRGATVGLEYAEAGMLIREVA